MIYLEDLQVRTMSRRRAPKSDGNGNYAHNGASRKAGLNTSIQDAETRRRGDVGWSAFRRILTCKAAWAGKRVKAIPPAFTTQDCSMCGEEPICNSLSIRTLVCTTCGLMRDRDENAARNILTSGRAGPSGANVGGVDAPSVA